MAPVALVTAYVPAQAGDLRLQTRQRASLQWVNGDCSLTVAPSLRPRPPNLEVASPLAKDLAAFNTRLEDGLRAGLLFLNARTPHRFTGVYRFDAEMLRSVALVDKWDATVMRGEDVPLAQAYCAHLHETGEAVDIPDGRIDRRFPSMQASSVLSYCGAVINDGQGARWGALCHFDTLRCESRNSELPMLVAAAALLHHAASASAS